MICIENNGRTGWSPLRWWNPVMALLICAVTVCLPAVDVNNLPANTWETIVPTTVQPVPADEQGQWMQDGWNKLCYDPVRKQVLFYDRWYDVKHGGYTIYGNCLFGFDPETTKLTPIKIANWQRVDPHYTTVPLPENSTEPTPCDRHVYCAFDYVVGADQIYLCNGANQAAKNGSTVGHDNCFDTWKFDMATKVWSKVNSAQTPPNNLEDGMAYCPDINSIVYAGHGKIWILNLATGQWKKSATELPRVHMGMAVVYDAPRKRMLLAGGGTYDQWAYKSGGFNKLYAFDPVTEALTNLQDCPTAMLRMGLAHDTQHDQFFCVTNLAGKTTEQDWGMFRYDPVNDQWTKVVGFGGTQPDQYEFVQMCYDAHHDCLVALNGAKTEFKVFRYVPVGGGSNQPPAIQSGIAASPNPVVNANTTGLSVTATDPDGGPSILSYTWTKLSGPGNVFFAPNGGTSANTTTATFDASGTYALQVTISDGAATISDVLSNLSVTLPAVGVAPTISAQPGNVTVSAGQTATFSVTAVGAAPLTYQWKRGTTNVGTNVDSLILVNAQAADAGTYTVTVSNVFGTAVSNPATLTVTPGSGGANPITLNAGSLSLSAPTGSLAVVSAPLTLTNTSGTPVTVVFAASTGWLSVDASAVTIGPGASTTVQIGGNPSGLAGTVSGTVTLTNTPGGATQVMPVTLSVASAGTGTGAGTIRKRGGCNVGTAGPSLLLVAGLLGLLAGLARRRNRLEAVDCRQRTGIASACRAILACLLLTLPGLALALDVSTVPANTWVKIEPTLAQPANPDEQGQWNAAGWNKIVYDAKNNQCLFYDRWYDKKHGGYTIYGNCLYGFDVVSGKLTPIKIANWKRKEDEHYNTYALPENEKDPTPCDRHVYCAFDFAADTNSVYICNGANQAAKTPTVTNHEVVHDTWRFDLAKKTWVKIPSKEMPPNKLEDGMAYCPDTKSIVYAGHGKIWLFDIATGQWRPAKESLPRGHMGMAVVYDPPRKRMLLVGGGSYDKWHTKSGGFNCIYSFDPKTEKVTPLADCPTALCRAGLAYNSKVDLFFVVVDHEGKTAEQPSGMFCYDPKKDAWSTVKYQGERPGKYQWTQMCYDSKNDLLVAMEQTHFKVFRFAPAANLLVPAPVAPQK